MTDEQLEKQISEEFEKMFHAPSTGEIMIAIMEDEDSPQTVHFARKEGFKAAALPLMKKIEELKEEAAIVNKMYRRTAKEYEKLQKENHWLLVQYKMGAQMKCDNEELRKENEELRKALNFVIKEAGYELHPDYEKEFRIKFNLD